MRLFAAWLIALTGTLALAADPDPIQVLDAAQAAMQRADAVQYSATGVMSGAPGRALPPMEGTLWLARLPDEDGFKLKADMRWQLPNEETPAHIELTCDGREVHLLDHRSKVYVELPLPRGNALLNNVRPLLVAEFVQPHPFALERKSNLTYVGTETIDNTLCDIVRAAATDDTGSVAWYFGHDDHLPRKVVRTEQTRAGQTTATTEIRKITLGPELKDVEFAAAQPDGYRNPMRQAPGLLEVGTAAPDFTLKDAAGHDVALHDLRGKVVLLDFWATWCGPCKLAMPGLQKLHEKYADKPVQIIGVNCRERGADPVAFMKSKNYTYTLLVQGDAVALQYQVRGIPTFYLIAPDGKIALANAGFSPQLEETLGGEIDALLGANQATSAPSASKTPD